MVNYWYASVNVDSKLISNGCKVPAEKTRKPPLLERQGFEKTTESAEVSPGNSKESYVICAARKMSKESI
jgi:hypothetical protein